MPTPEKMIEEKFDEVLKVHHDFKKLHESEIADMKKNQQAAADRIERTEKANEHITKLQGEIEAMKAALNRSTLVDANGQPIDEKKAAYKKAYNTYLRKGGKYENEVKAMNEESDADGGFLVPIEMSSEIVKKVFESSPMREISSVQSISSSQLEIFEDLDEMASGWVGESQARTSTATPALKKIMIPVHELYAMPPASQNLLDDAAINLESWIAEKVSDKFARDESTAFVNGNGVMKPKGILQYGAGDGFGLIEQIVSGSAAAITADGLISLVYSLKEPYHNGAQFIMRRASEKSVRKLKDSQNRYLWEPGLNGQSQATLLGYGIKWAADMDAEGSNALCIAFGNFKAGYQIVDRVGIRILRDPYSSKGQVLFYTTKRVGGGVKNFEAIKLQKCST